MGEPSPGAREIPLMIRHGSEEAGRTTLAPDPNATDKLAAEFVPGKPGKYEHREALTVPSKPRVLSSSMKISNQLKWRPM
jgi:hypothetical protein